MDEQRHAQFDRGRKDWGEFRIVQISATNIGGDMTTNKAMVADATPQFACGRIRILHRQ